MLIETRRAARKYDDVALDGLNVEVRFVVRKMSVNAQCVAGKYGCGEARFEFA